MADAKAAPRSLRRISRAGEVRSVAGLDASTRASAVAVGAAGSIYVAEFVTVIKISRDGTAVMLTGVGDNTLIVGFVLAGSAPKTVLIRAAGPSLVGHGLGGAGVLDDPKLMLYRGAALIDGNDNGGGTIELKAIGQAVGAFEFDSDASKDAARLVTLVPGIYTAHVAGANADTGVAPVEIYEVPCVRGRSAGSGGADRGHRRDGRGDALPRERSMARVTRGRWRG